LLSPIWTHNAQKREKKAKEEEENQARQEEEGDDQRERRSVRILKAKSKSETGGDDVAMIGG
jgi:hypothetical protein